MTNIEAILTNYDRIFKGTTMWKEQRSFLKQSLTSFEKEIREAEQIRIEIELDGAYPKDGNIPKRDIATALEEQRQSIIQEIVDKYGDYRFVVKKGFGYKIGRTLRFFLLPHFQHKKGDDYENL